MEKFRQFLLKHRFWVYLLSMFALGFMTLRVFILAVVQFAGYEKLFVGVIITHFGFSLLRVIYEFQDDYWYRVNYEKTGDDFEGRYINAK